MAGKLEADVVIIGGGASGITAAVAAAEKDASVIVIEKGGSTGGAANMGMGFFAVGSSYQGSEMVDLSVEDAFRFFMEYSHWKTDARLVRKYFGMSADTVEWVEAMGISFLGAYKYFKQSKQTWHVVKTQGSSAPAERAASNLFKAITDRAVELGVEIMYFTKATEILMEGGRATGVRIVLEDGSVLDAECSCVIVASGGFGDEPAMIKEYTGYEWGKDLHSFRVPGIVGEGLKMMWAAGAGKNEPTMEMIYTTPGVTNSYKTISETMRQPNLFVNLDGMRFMNEEISNNTVYTGNALSRQRERVAFSIIDDSIVDSYRGPGLDYITYHHNIKTVDKWDYEVDAYLSGKAVEGTGVDLGDMDLDEQRDAKAFTAAGSIEELCGATGIDLENLKATIEEYNRAAASGDDKLFFKKREFLRPLAGGRIYAAKHYPGAYGSLGGVMVNDNLEVLTQEGAKIPGLYSCGVDACGIFGDSYCFYLPGSTMGFALNSGRIAGANAIDYIDSDDFVE
ncbi:MAG: FAD-dependent oxidoreductase [Clostridiales bacterium]|nr:FAD-dependent oxidoreductase [Clostridiales bacterium]